MTRRDASHKGEGSTKGGTKRNRSKPRSANNRAHDKRTTSLSRKQDAAPRPVSPMGQAGVPAHAAPSAEQELNAFLASLPQVDSTSPAPPPAVPRNAAVPSRFRDLNQTAETGAASIKLPVEAGTISDAPQVAATTQNAAGSNPSVTETPKPRTASVSPPGTKPGKAGALPGAPKSASPRGKRLPRPKNVTAKELTERISSMQGIPAMQLPESWGANSVWHMLSGQQWQQRVFTWGNSSLCSAVGLGKAASSPHTSLSILAATQLHPSCCSDVDQVIDQLPQRYTSSAPLSVVEGVEFTCISAGKSHAAASSAHSAGHVYVWGSNQWGQLGTGSDSSWKLANGDAQSKLVASHLLHEWQSADARPALDTALSALPGTLLRGMAAGEAMDQRKQWLEQGDNRVAKLEDAANCGGLELHASSRLTKSQGTDQQATEDAQPAGSSTLAVMHVHRLQLGKPVLAVACGASHTLAALSGGGVWGWGANTNGQVGISSATHIVSCPIPVPELSRLHVVQLSGGGAHSGAVTIHGDLWMWGDCSWGQCGQGSSTFSVAPSKVTAVNGKSIAQVACGTAHTLALTTDGEVYSWGANWTHQLGLQDTEERLWPVKLTQLPVCKAVAAAGVSLAVSEAGRLYVWGWDPKINPRPEQRGIPLGFGLLGNDVQGAEQQSDAAEHSPEAADPADAAEAVEPSFSPLPIPPTPSELPPEAPAATEHEQPVQPEPVSAPPLEPPAVALPESEPQPPQPAIFDLSSLTSAKLEAFEKAVVATGSAAHRVEQAEQPPAVESGDAAADDTGAAGEDDGDSRSVQEQQQQQQQVVAEDMESWAAAPRPPRKHMRTKEQPAPPAAPPPPPPPPPRPISSPGRPPLPGASKAPTGPGAVAGSMGSSASAAVARAAALQGSVCKTPVVREVTWLQPQVVKAVACSTSHVVLVTAEGVMYSWGDQNMLSHHATVSGARRVQPPPPDPNELTAANLQRLAAAEGASAPDTLCTLGARPAYTFTAGGNQSACSTIVGDRRATVAFSVELSPVLAPEPTASSRSHIKVASDAAIMPTGEGGAPLSVLCDPALGTAVWILSDETLEKQQQHSMMYDSGPVQAAAARSVSSVSGVPSQGPEAFSELEHEVKVKMEVFNGRAFVTLEVVPVMPEPEAAAQQDGSPFVSPRDKLSSKGSVRTRGSVKGGSIVQAPSCTGSLTVVKSKPKDPAFTSVPMDFPELHLLPAASPAPQQQRINTPQKPAATATRPLLPTTGSMRSAGTAHTAAKEQSGAQQEAMGSAAVGSVSAGEEELRSGKQCYRPLPREGLLPVQERVYSLAAGELHTLCLCGTTRYAATQSELHLAGSHLLESYAKAWCRAQGKQLDILQPLALPGSAAPPRPDEGAIKQALLPQPWRNAPSTAQIVDLHMAVVLCKLVGLLDNATDFQDLTACFSHTLKQRAALKAAAHAQGLSEQPPDLLEQLREGELDWQALQAQLDVEAASAADTAANARSMDMARAEQSRSRDTSPLSSKRKDGLDRPDSTALSRLRLIDFGSLLETNAAGSYPAGSMALTASRTCLTPEEFLSMLMLLVAKRSPSYVSHPALLLRLLCKQHLVQLKTACLSPVAWLNSRALDPNLQLLLDCGPTSELLHQCYVYMANVVSNDPAFLEGRVSTPPAGKAQQGPEGVPADLQMPLRDARQGLRPPSVPRWLPLSRVCQFMRQAGLLPKVLSKLLSELIQDVTEAYKFVPMSEHTPWWWPRTRTPIVIPGGYGDFRKEPTSVDPLSRQVLMAVLNEFDIMGVAIPRTRKAFNADMSSELYLQLEAKKRERLLAYVLVGLLGPRWIQLQHPRDLQPKRFLALKVTYPQFVEAISACLVLKCTTQEPAGRLLKEVRPNWPRKVMQNCVAESREGMRVWRDRLLNPWRYKRIIHSDSELERVVDKVFSLYCTIDPLAERIGVSAPALLEIVSESDLMDSYLNVERLTRIFVASEGVSDETAANFGANEISGLKAQALSSLPADVVTAATWSGLTVTQLARLKKSPVALDVAEQSLADQLESAAGRGVAGEESFADMRAQPVAAARDAHQARLATWDAHSAAFDAAPKPGELPVDEDESPRTARSAGGVGFDNLQLTSHEASTALMGMLAGQPAPVGFRNVRVATSRLAEEVATPLRAQLADTRSGVTEHVDVQVALEKHFEEMQQHFGPVPAAVVPKEPEDSSAPFSPAKVLQHLQLDTLGAELEMGMLGSTLQRWASFSTTDFGRTPAASGAPSPARISPITSPQRTSPLRDTRSSSPSRFLDAEHVSSTAMAQHYNVRTLGQLKAHELGDGLPSPAGPADPHAARDAAAAVTAVKSVLQSHGSSQAGHLSLPPSREGQEQELTPGAGLHPVPLVLLPMTSIHSSTQIDPPTTTVSVLPSVSSWPQMPVEEATGTPLDANPLEHEPLVQAPHWLASSTSVWQAPDSAPSSDQKQNDQGDAAGTEVESLRPQSPPHFDPFLTARPSMIAPSDRPISAMTDSVLSDAALSMRASMKRPAHASADSPSRLVTRVSIQAPGAKGAAGHEAKRAWSPPKATSAVNRLTTTRADLGMGTKEEEEAAARTPPPAASLVERLVLSRAQFGEALRRIAVAKYAKISSPTAAWRILVERHILPVGETKTTKYDAFLAALMSPIIISTILAWEPQLKQTFHMYAEDSSALATDRTETPASRGSRRGDGRKVTPRENGKLLSRQSTLKTRADLLLPLPGERTTANLSVTFIQFLQLCTDRGLVGHHGLAPSDLEQVFRRVHFLDGDFTTGIQGMGYAQFVDAAAMMGLMMLSDSRCERLLPQIAALPATAPVEVRLSAFFTHLCGLKKPPNQVLQATAASSKVNWPDALPSAASLYKDPYQEWTALGAKGFDQTDSKPLSYLSSQYYKPVLLQELVVPPAPYPTGVSVMLDKAVVHHNAGEYSEALTAYAEARNTWRGLLIDASKGHRVGLTCHQKIYFGLATASVHLSAGRAALALAIYESLLPELDKLPVDHPNHATLASARGYALYVSGDLPAAYTQFVQAKVLRETAPGVGPLHVDTALANHNLACCLDGLGNTHRALQLLGSAAEMLKRVLGPSHPRTEVALRNLEHMAHKGCSQVEYKYHVPVPEKPKSQKNEIPFSKTRKGTAAVSSTAATQQEPTEEVSVPRLTPAERLAVFQLRTASQAPGVKPVVSSSKSKALKQVKEPPPKRFKKPTDLDYLGGGMFQATPDMVSLWTKMRPMVEAHAAGNTLRNLPPDVVPVMLNQPVPVRHTHTQLSALTASSTRAPGHHEMELPELPPLPQGIDVFQTVTRGGVPDDSLAPRVLDQKTAMHVYQAALRQGVKLPGLNPLLQPGGRGMGAASSSRNKSGLLKTVWRDRLGELLAPSTTVSVGGAAGPGARTAWGTSMRRRSAPGRPSLGGNDDQSASEEDNYEDSDS